MKRIYGQFARFLRHHLVYTALICAAMTQGAAIQAAGAQMQLVATPVGAVQVLFDPKRDGCDGNDVPDAPLRAYRDAADAIVAFGLHFENRRLMGPRLDALKIDCKLVFRGIRSSNPKAYDDRSWITATWTRDGKTIHALAHHEFQAHAHKGRCAFPDYMKCWWNSVLAITSTDGGSSFTKANPAVMAASPEPSEIGQGRHRGFFNPSNIIERGGAYFTLIGTTGWEGQPSGVCLFRTQTLADSSAWRAFDGKAFSVRFPDPYSEDKPNGQTCLPLAPFPAPVGSVTQHRETGLYIAMFQAAEGMPDGHGGTYPQSGFYAASSADLIQWSAPTLVMATKSLYDKPCGESHINSYPVLMDPLARGRNFDDTGDEAMLFFSQMRIDGCSYTHDRVLVARKLRISSFQAD